MGDPAGIGPEITAKVLTGTDIFHWCRPVVVGNRKVLERACEVCGLKNVFENRRLSFDFVEVEVGDTQFGKFSANGGRAAFDFIAKATDLCLSGKAKAMVTAPINKEALRLAGVDFIGHTEILAGLTNSVDPLTMFYVKGLKVFFLTRHVPFSKISSLCTEERIFEYIVRCTEYLKGLNGCDKPFAVAALNPHAGDSGLFGEEEKNAIYPAIVRAKGAGINVEGPVPADSVFHMALNGTFSGVLSLYHDQGHIATKTLDFEKTIAVTYGLPFLRTSVDHGTAFDIAGTGTASEKSLAEAFRVVAELI